MIEQTEHIHPLLGGHCIHFLEDIADYSYCTKNKEANNILILFLIMLIT